MNDFITLTCPSCGGKLEITEDVQQFACAHCGIEHQVNRSTSIVSISPIVEGIKSVQIGVDKTASELAIKRLKEEIDYFEKEYAKIFSNRIELILRMIGWGIIGLIGIVPLVMGLKSGEFSTILIGIFIAGFGIFVFFQAYTKRIVLNKEMKIILNKAKIKNDELFKHKKIVNG